MVTPTFIAASLAILLTPGPTNTLLAASGAAMGFKRAISMPFAEALGYAIAISFYVVLAQNLSESPAALFFVKATASVWLMYTAFRLWKAAYDVGSTSNSKVFFRIIFTTIINPKAMLVGTVLIPSENTENAYLWIISYVFISIFAGLGWLLVGSSMPLQVRQHSYKVASIVLCFFSIAAGSSAVLS